MITEWYVNKWFWLELNYRKTAMLLMAPFFVFFPLIKIAETVFENAEKFVKK